MRKIRSRRGLASLTGGTFTEPIPGWISETLEAMGEDGGRGTPVAVVAEAYRSFVEGEANGRTVVPR